MPGKSNGHAGMFVGDGINDAPVLAGADAAIEAADVVFMKSSMEAIPQSIEIAKTSCRISRQPFFDAPGLKARKVLFGNAKFMSC